MPLEVFEAWIRPEIERNGYQRPFLDSELKLDPLARLLRGKSLEYWCSIRWRLVKAHLKNAPFDDTANKLALQLVERWRTYETMGIWSPTIVANSKERLERCLVYVRNNENFPSPLVCAIDGTKWQVLDGHHRLAALHLVPFKTEVEFEVWLGDELIEG